MRHLIRLGIAAILAFAALSARAEDFCAQPVETGQGKFSGQVDPKHPACAFLGIPFAQPPVGPFRLHRPEPPAPHAGTVAAVKFGPSCMQEEDPLNGGKSEAYGEDCLYLNVWRPAKSGVFPTMVWIYGGGFVGGAGSFDIYNGSQLASRQDVVIVTLNYRLGPLGFLALPELQQEDPKSSTGNYGIQDQVQALGWVRDNIANFGGDPQNVTVFGQSAGGMSICVLLASPESAGLFHQAMIMSAPCRLFTGREEGLQKGRDYAASVGCAGDHPAECLRAKPASAFLQKAPNDLFNGGVSWSPTVDGAFLPDLPLKLIAEGKYHRVPLIIGTTRDELRIYTMTVPGLGTLTRGEVSWFMRRLLGPVNAKQILSLYNYDDYRRPIDLAFAFGNQMVFDTPSFLLAEAVSKEMPVYLYRFDWNQTRMPHKMGAFHALDVPFVFGAMNPDLDLAKLLASKSTYKKNEFLSYIMMDYVANFAKTGNPNGGGHPAWPAYTSAQRNRLYFNTEISTKPLTERETMRYTWYADRTLREVLAGPLANRTEKK
jgi:para-nitrobenzyl esterase